MPSFDFLNARNTIETALRDTLLLAAGRRLPAAQTTGALAALPSPSAAEDDLRFVVDQNRSYRFRRADTRTADGTYVIAPDDLPPSGAGRWHRSSSEVSSGYLERCELYNEDDDEETMIERLLSKRPALLLTFTGARHKPASNRAGALYWYAPAYRILAISTNMRGDEAARHGSPKAAEAKVDPGTAAILGHAKTVLATSDLGLGGAVERVELGDERPVLVALAKRTVVESLDVVVWSTVRAEDDSLVPLEGADAQFTPSGDDATEFSVDEDIRFVP